MITKKDIKRATLDLNTTSAAVAEKLGITPQNYNNLMDKNARLNQQDLIKIADALGVKYVSSFINDKGETIAGGECDISELEDKK